MTVFVYSMYSEGAGHWGVRAMVAWGRNSSSLACLQPPLSDRSAFIEA
jgi:hypothetical protein